MDFKKLISGSFLSIVFLSFFVGAIAGINYAYGYLLKDSNSNTLGSIVGPADEIITNNVSENIIEVKPNIEINAESVISIESNLQGYKNIVVEKDIDKRLPIASLTKLMTAVIVLDNYNLSDIIVIDKIADSQEPMKQDVKFDDSMTVGNLLDIMLIRSSNKAAFALAEGPKIALGSMVMAQRFIGLMNMKAREIGMGDTFFVDSTGLSDDNISTANDLSKLAEYILRNEKYSKISEISKIKKIYIPGIGEIENTNELVGEIPDIVCSKTGFTTAAKGCLLLVTNNPNNDNYLINIVLGADDRFSEMKKIVGWSTEICN